MEERTEPIALTTAAHIRLVGERDHPFCVTSTKRFEEGMEVEIPGYGVFRAYPVFIGEDAISPTLIRLGRPYHPIYDTAIPAGTPIYQR